jgi:hypothetical protein
VGKRVLSGLMVGIVAGILDVIPMVLQHLTWDASLSAFSPWVVVGFMVATSNLRLPATVKGIVIAFLCLSPSAFIIGWSNPMSLIPVCVITLILGALIGFVFQRIIRE